MSPKGIIENNNKFLHKTAIMPGGDVQQQDIFPAGLRSYH
jgi:hypothetical protein